MRRLAVGLCARPRDGALLVEQGEDRLNGHRYYRAIGGGIEGGETEEEALLREWIEELGLRVRILRKLGTIDNRFIYEEREGHELVAVFEIDPGDAAIYEARDIVTREPMGEEHVAEWVTPDVLRSGGRPLYPVGTLELWDAR